MKKLTPLLLIGGLSLITACTSGYDNNTTRGAAGGAAAGAIIGGIIGHQSGEAGAGAALGAAAGAAVGGTAGHQKDKQISTSNYRDSYGYTSDDYYNLLNSEERDTLRARTGGRRDVELTSFLSAEERSNLRRRATGRSDIGR